VASNLTGDYAVALQIEDFVSPMDITPLSSVPVQFVVRVEDIFSNPPCNSQLEFVGTAPLDGTCIGVPFNTSWNARITARVSNRSRASTITEFVSGSPFGLKRSDLIPSDSTNPGEWQLNVTWTPNESQLGLNIFCYAALDNLG
jgi:hypothetical protein